VNAAVARKTHTELFGRPAGSYRPLWEFVKASGLVSLVVAASKDPNAKVTVLLLSRESGRPMLAVKAPTTDAAARAVEAEAAMLVELRKLEPRSMLETIPRLVDVVEFHGRPAVVMTAVEGKPMATSYFRWRHTASHDCVAADFRAIDCWLAEFQRASAGEAAPLDMDAGVSVRLANRFAADEGIAADLELLGDIYARLRTNSVALTAVHGDLWFGNVLLTDGRATGVVDWEAAAVSGAPSRDVVRFALMYALYLDRRTRAGRRVMGHAGLRAGTWGAGIEYALDGTGWFPALFRGFVRDSLARLGASPDNWRDTVLAGIAEVAAFTDEEGFARSHLELFRRVARRPPLDGGKQAAADANGAAGTSRLSARYRGFS
jgi:aminoglycoside phosphotransferase (APT) family kinase protein